MILGIQIKAARVLLKMSQSELSGLAKTSVDTLKRIERSEGDYKGSAELFIKIQSILENRGIKFEKDHEGQGVKLLKRP